MTARTWTRDEVTDFVAGHIVLVFDCFGESLPIPEWILAAAYEAAPFTVMESLEAAHPDYRPGLLELFTQMLENPGEIVSAPARYFRENHWEETVTSLLNLCDDPDFGFVVASVPVGDHVDEEVDLSLANAGESDAVAWFMANLDRAGRVLHVEGRVDVLLGRDPEVVVGNRFTDFLHPDGASTAAAMWLRMTQDAGSTSSSRRCFVKPDGELLWAECTYLNRLEPGGGGDVLLLAIDITERRAQEEALRRSHEEIRRLADDYRMLADDFRLLADEVPAAVFRCDADGTITFHNARWTEMVAPTYHIVSLRDAFHADDRHLIDVQLSSLVSGKSMGMRRIEARAAVGDRVWQLTARPIPDEDASHWRIVGSIEDVTATVQLRRKSRHDPLTGLNNREAIEEHLRNALATDPTGTVLAFVDLDGFKEVNDSHGHEVGDAVLREVGARLATAVRSGDHVGRFGGDEFVVIFRDALELSPDDLAARLGEVIGAPISLPSGMWDAGASIGTTRLEPSDDPASAMRRADFAMYGRKRERHEARRGPVRTHARARR